MAIDGDNGGSKSSLYTYKSPNLPSDFESDYLKFEVSDPIEKANIDTKGSKLNNQLASAFFQNNNKLTVMLDKKDPIPGDRNPDDDLRKTPDPVTFNGNRSRQIEVLQEGVGANGFDTSSSGEVYYVADLISIMLDIDINESLTLVNNLIDTGNLTDGMSGEEIYYKLNGPRYSLLGANPNTDNFIKGWQPHQNQQDQINELNQQIQTFEGVPIAGPTNQGEPHVWGKGLAIAHSVALMMAIDPFEARELVLEYHTAGHLTEDMTAEEIFNLFDANNDSIIDHKDAILDAETTASRSDITPDQIESLINGPYRNNAEVIQNLVNNNSVSNESILDLVYSPELGPVSAEILTIVANSDRIKDANIAGAIYNAENTTSELKALAAQTLGISNKEDEGGHHGLWHRAKDWFHHVEQAVKDDYSALAGLEDDFFNNLGTAGEIAGFAEGLGVEGIEFFIATQVISAAVAALASAGFTVVAAGAAVAATEIGIEELIAHIKDPDAGHLTGPLGSTIKSVVTTVAHQAKDLIADLPSNISNLVNSGYVLVVPDDRAEPAKFVNPHTDSGAQAIEAALDKGAKLYANEHTQDKLSDTYVFEGTTQQFKHERPFEHGVALGHFVGKAIQEVLVLKDIAEIALNAGKTGIEAIVNKLTSSTSEDLNLVTEITTGSGETFSPREYANILNDNSNTTQAFNDYLKLSKEERIAVRHEGFKPQPPLELESNGFFELNNLLAREGNNITAHFTFDADGNLEIYLKDSANLTVDAAKRAAIEQKILETLGNQVDSSSVKTGNFNWLGPNEAVPSDNFNAVTLGKGGNLEGLKGGTGEAGSEEVDSEHLNLDQNHLTENAANTYTELQAPVIQPPTGQTLPGDITIGKQIGSGTTGTVYEATGPNGEKYVVKTSSNPVGDYHEQAVLNHLADVDGVMKTHTTFIEPAGEGGEPGRLWAVREFVPKDVSDQAYSTEAGESLLKTLTEVHAKDIAHQDILLENIRLREDGTPTLIDFGRATTIEAPQENMIDMGLSSQAHGPAVHDVNSTGFSLWQWKFIDKFGGSAAEVPEVMQNFADALKDNYLSSLESLDNDGLKEWLTSRGHDVPAIVDRLEGLGKTEKARAKLLETIENQLTPAETQTRENILGATGLTEDQLTEEDLLLLDMMTTTDGTAQQFLERYQNL